MAFSCKGPSGSNQAPWSCLLTARSAPRQGLASPPPLDPQAGQSEPHTPQNPTPGPRGRVVPRGSRALSKQPPWGGYHWPGVSHCGGVVCHRVQAHSSVGWRVDGTPCPPAPHTPGVQSGLPPCPKREGRGGREGTGVPGSKGGCVCGCLPPAGHAGGALPVITASAAKLQSRAGASLPPSRPPCLSHPPPSPPFPKPSWHRIHGRSPGAAAGSSSPNETSLCPRLPQWVLGPQHTLLGASLPLPLQPRAAPGWWGGKGLLLLSARTEPLCCPLPRKGSDPSSPHIPTGAASSPQTQLRGFGIRGAPVRSRCSWHSHKPPGTGLTPTQPRCLA